MTRRTYLRRPHAVLDLPFRRLKAVKIDHLLNLTSRPQALNLPEIRTGSGGVAHYFANHESLHCEVVVVDAVDQRLLTDGYTFKQVSDTSLPFPDGYFDVVITNHVIEHVGDQLAQRHHLHEVRRVLNDEGVGYLAVPNRWMLVEPHYRLAFLSWLPRPLRTPYLRLMRRGTQYDCEPLPLGRLERLLDDTGFRYQNMCTQALRETLALEGGKGVPVSVIARLPNHVLDRLACAIPTLIYRLERQAAAVTNMQ